MNKYVYIKQNDRKTKINAINIKQLSNFNKIGKNKKQQKKRKLFVRLEAPRKRKVLTCLILKSLQKPSVTPTITKPRKEVYIISMYI